MFKKQLISFLSLWLALVLMTYWLLHLPSSQAREAYQRLMDFSDQTIQADEEKMQMTQQTRHQIGKQIFYKQDQHRLQSRLISEHSTLVFNQKGHGAELIEHFKNITCTTQEKLFYHAIENKQKDASPILNSENLQPQQLLRHLKAEEAMYSYQTGQLEAEQVEFMRYLLPGHSWPLSFQSIHPLFEGQAQKVKLKLFQDQSFKAQGFQASFYELGDL